MGELERFLRTVTDFGKTQGLRCGLYEMLLEHGREFESKPKPDDMEWGIIGECFKNAWHRAFDSWAIEDERYQYAEGLGMSFLPVQHAWVVDREDGKAIDLTWNPEATGKWDREYFGIVIADQRWLNKLTLSRGFCGSVLEEWSNDFLLNDAA